MMYMLIGIAFAAVLPDFADLVFTWIAGIAGHRDAPAWVQAIGTILALGIAVLVPWLTHWFERRREIETNRIRARALAVAIFPELLELGAKRLGAAKQVERWSESMGATAAAGAVRAAALKLPPVIGGSVERLYLLGPAAAPVVLQLAAVASQYDRMVEEFAGHVERQARAHMGTGKTGSVYFDGDSVKALTQYLNVIARLLDASIAVVGPLHDQGDTQH